MKYPQSSERIKRLTQTIAVNAGLDGHGSRIFGIRKICQHCGVVENTAQHWHDGITRPRGGYDMLIQQIERQYGII